MMYGIWIEFIDYLILLALFILVFIRGSFTALHRIYLLFHLFMLNWPLGQTVLYMAETPEYRLYILKIMYICLSMLGFGWYVFSVFLTGRSYILTKKHLPLAVLPSLLTAAIIVWNPNGMFVEGTGARLMESRYGPLFWLLVVVLLGYMARAIQLMLRTLRDPECTPHLRKQVQMAQRGLILFVMFGVADITINVIFRSNGMVVPGLLSMGMTLSGLYFVIAIRRNRLFDLIEIAQQDVINSMTTGIVVMNDEGIVADINRAMRPIVPFRVGDRFDMRAMLRSMRAVAEQTELFIEWHEAKAQERLEIEVLVPASGQARRHVVIVSAPIEAKKHQSTGRVITVQDVTDYRMLLEATRRQNETLQIQNKELLMMQEELSTANRKLEQMAVTDGLTGCFNRRYLMGKIESELPKLAEHHASFAIMLFDIDLFKKVNDTFGHLAGDAVLVRTAQKIQELIGPHDILARYGGEEFTVFMPNVTSEHAANMAEKIRDEIARNEVVISEQHLVGSHHKSEPMSTLALLNGKKLAVTVSMGVVVEHKLKPSKMMDPANYLRQLLAVADEALYEAKNAGRNQVICREAKWEADEA
ncbi:diguanylate cyclase [Paenibacillus curdlanolyticus YK9]|uniref:Diguanylate cyclase n=1 Tax=Paenibacillus curdlanolyticus YK9 TaxID=717606 RepID=E0I9T7_9BACL|nr:diguanylate cyclase [Paenibacillus curdlanolyticus]EFM10514.1 diguanylate cyclase [Paenibacillus curdlanolyticus YK9]